MEQQKNWILMTGVTRGIGRSLAEEFRKMGFFVCGLVRSENCAAAQPHLDAVLPWDLSLAWESNASPALLEFVARERVIGLIHAAGVLGSTNPVPEATDVAAWTSWWADYALTDRINHKAGLELIWGVKKSLVSWSTKRGQRTPFVLHLSSGAAVKPYAGWDAYCTSKAAMLMAFRTLAAKTPASELKVLSVAPGTVMTDMMKSVLSAREENFPALSKFKALEKSGGLVAPEVPAKKICSWLVDSLDADLCSWHGELYDVRDSSPATK